MLLEDLVKTLEEIAPTRHAEPWDNVGLLTGDPRQSISRAFLTIDYTHETAAESRNEHCDVIIAYHPPIFEPLKRITAPSLIHDAIRRGVAIYSPHTALDVADGGTNDMLADALDLPQQNRQPLRITPPKSTQCKLVVFSPADAADRVSAAMFEAGAGRIGQYSRCSFRSPGTGTFFGEEGSNPAVGEAGRLEQADEIRIETVVPLGCLDKVIQAMRKSHPYETPAFDLLQLAAPPEGKGQGRIGDLTGSRDRAQLIERIKRELGLSHLLIAGPTTGPVRRVACCAGACGDLLADALSQNADLYLTGEMRHHDAIKAASKGMTVVCTLHSNSERKVLHRLASRIQQELPQLPLLISKTDRDPFSIV